MSRSVKIYDLARAGNPLPTISVKIDLFTRTGKNELTREQGWNPFSRGGIHFFISYTRAWINGKNERRSHWDSFL
jgi:hypothetical protein